MSNVANNIVAGDGHATDAPGMRVQLKSTNTAGVHQLHQIRDPLTPGVSSKLAFTSASAQSGVLAGTIVRVVATQNCHLAFGANPTAAADGSCIYLPLGTTAYFSVASGCKVAAVQDSAPGNLFITVMA